MKNLNSIILPSFNAGLLGSIGYLTAPYNAGLSLFCLVIALLMLILFTVNAVHYVKHG